MKDAVRTLGLQLAALAQQDFAHNWEVVVVNNGSTDGSAELVAKWCEADGRFRTVDATGIASAAYARNIGIAEAQADVLLFCDADDAVMPSWISAMYAALADADLVGSRFDITAFTKDIKPEDLATYSPVLLALPDLDEMRWAGGGGLGIHRAVLEDTGGWLEELKVGEDVMLSWQAQERGYTLMFSDDAVVLWRPPASVYLTMVRQFRSGASTPQLLGTMESLGFDVKRFRRPVASAFRHWVSLGIRFFRSITNAGMREALLIDVSGQLGRVYGSIRHRRICL